MISSDKDFREIVANKDALRKGTERALDNIVDDITLGIIFDVHRQYKTGAYSLIERDGMVSSYAIKEDVTPHFDIFGQYNQKQNHACTCPKCSRSVAAQRFAPHLAECMGSGRLRSRKGGRMNLHSSSSCNGSAADRSESCSSYSEVPSDDDDVEWSSAEKRRKKKHRNGKQKGKSTPKKNAAPESDAVPEILEYYEVIHRRIMEDLSKSKTSTESVVSSTTSSSSSTSASKRRDKSKSKKSRRDRTGSPLDSLD